MNELATTARILATMSDAANGPFTRLRKQLSDDAQPTGPFSERNGGSDRGNEFRPPVQERGVAVDLDDGTTGTPPDGEQELLG